MAETIINDGKVDGPVKRFEAQFLKDIRAMVEGHTQRNLQLYAEMIERRRYLLLKEKLKRLRAAQQNEELAMINLFEAQRQPTLEEIDWGSEGKPSRELLEARACMARINEREDYRKLLS